MKRICIILMVCLLCLLPAMAFAASPSPDTQQTPDMGQPTPESSEEPYSMSFFTIDNNNVYEGMDKAYKDGYMPAVQNGKAVIILPLVSSGEIQGNRIQVTPNFGDTISSPFVFKNYQKTIMISDNKVNDGQQTVSSYYIRFDLDLSSSRTNGTYPIMIDIQATDTSGNQIAQTFTTYITITDGIDPNAAQAPDDSVPADAQPTEKPTSQPIVIVSNHTVSPSPINAGEEFTVNITLLNTNKSKSVQNMTITVTSEEKNLTLLNDSNTIYFDKLGSGKTLSLELKYEAGLEIIPGKYNINLALSYDNSEAVTLTSAGLVPIEVHQPMRVQLTIPQIAETVNAGDTLPLSFQVMNLGRGSVYNVRCEVSGAGLMPSGSAFIGNMEPGTAANADVNVFIGTKDMTEGYEGMEKYGVTEGTVKLIYEDAGGEEFTEEYTFTTTINEPIINTSGNNEEKTEETAGQWWISLVVLGAAAAGIAVWLIIRKKRVSHGES